MKIVQSYLLFALGSALILATSASASDSSSRCPKPDGGNHCHNRYAPVACGIGSTGYPCHYGNRCLARAAGFDPRRECVRVFEGDDRQLGNEGSDGGDAAPTAEQVEGALDDSEIEQIEEAEMIILEDAQVSIQEAVDLDPLDENGEGPEGGRNLQKCGTACKACQLACDVKFGIKERACLIACEPICLIGGKACRSCRNVCRAPRSACYKACDVLP